MTLHENERNEVITAEPPDESTPNRLADVVFWAAAALLLFWALGARNLWTAEGRWAEIAREMLLTGRYFHPTINGVPYFDKPLLTYWMIALVAPLTGMNEWALRLPSAICGLAALWATRRLASRLWSPAAGRLAGWILLTAHGFLFWARTGQADIANLAFIMLTVLWYWERRDRPCFVTYLVFYVILFLGAQMKGLTAFVIPMLVVFPDLLADKRWKHLLTLQHFIALALGALVYVVPFVYSSMTRGGDYASNGLDLVFRENIQRFLDPFDHIEPWYAYFEHVPQLFLPWSGVLLLTLAAAAFPATRRRRTWASSIWPGLGMAFIFLFFTASGSRRSYYILPILPFCAMFCARLLLDEAGGWWRRTALTLQTALLLLVTFLAWAGVVAFAFYSERLPPIVPARALAPLLLAIAAASTLVWLAFFLRDGALATLTGLPRRVAPLVLSTAIFLGGGFCLLLPVLEANRTEKSFAQDVKATGRTADETAFFDHYLENIIFYMDMCPPYHPIIPAPAEAFVWLDADHRRVIILRRRNLEQMLEAFPADRRGREAVSETLFPWDEEKKIVKKMVAWTLAEPDKESL